MSFEPINDFILCEKIKYHTLSNLSSLVVVGENKNYVHKDLRVLAMPKNGIKLNGKYLESEVRVGDIVFVEKPAGLTISHNGNEFMLIRESDIIWIYDDYSDSGSKSSFSIGKNKTAENGYVMEAEY